MKLTGNEIFIDVEYLNGKLIDLRELLELLSDYFKYTDDYISKNPEILISLYPQYAALCRACIDAAENIQTINGILQEPSADI